jgi:hypothetical protein
MASFKRAVIYLIFVFWLPGVLATTPNYALLNEGKAEDLKRQLTVHYQESTGEARLKSLRDLLDLCILTEDAIGMTNVFGQHWEELVASFEALSKGSDEDKRTSQALYESYHTQYMYSTLFWYQEEQIKSSLRAFERPPLDPKSFYAPLNVAFGVKAATFVEKRDLARKLQRRARGLIFQKNLNLISVQNALVELAEISLYELHDVEDIRRLAGAFDGVTKRLGRDISQYFNPYVFVRLIRTFYDAGILNPQQELQAIEYLHRMYQRLQVAQDSIFENKKFAFYGYLALEQAFGTKRDISFEPAKYLYERDSQAFVAVGVKAYLEAAGLAPQGVRAGYGLTRILDWIEPRISTVGESLRRLEMPTFMILKSLDARLKSNEKNEEMYLEKFIAAQLAYFRRSGYTMLDKPPALSKPALIVNQYVLNRLGELSPNSEVLKNFFMFNILSINAAKDANKQISYALLESAQNEVERDQIINYVVVNDRYNKTTSEIYTEALLNIETNALQKNAPINTYPAIEKFQPIEALFQTTSIQLSRLASMPNNLTTVTTDALSRLNQHATKILIAETGNAIILSIVREGKSTARVLKRPLDGPVAEAIGLLASKKISGIPVARLRWASKIFSDYLFGVDFELTGDVHFVNGPLVSGVPYTLLSDPSSGKWLVEVAVPRAFASIAHAKLAQRQKPKIKAVKYVAFANPKFRSHEEQAKVEGLQSIIRGGRLDQLSELPETEIEVKAFASMFKSSEVELYLGVEANVDNLFSTDFENVETLSFNTHGVVPGEIESATSPSIILTPTERSQGVVSTEWLFSSRGSPRVAILSTCNSATESQNLDSSELTSLSSAFLLKGTDAVVASLWQVNSLGTTELMSELASGVASGSEYGRAIVEASRKLLNASGDLSHPSIWAAFVVVGQYRADVEPIVESTPRKVVANFSGPILDTAVIDGKSYFSVYSKDSGNGKLYEVDPTKDDMFSVVHEAPEGEMLRVSSNVERGLFFTQRSQDEIGFFEFRDKNNIRPICNAKVSLQWLLNDFFVDESTIFSLYEDRRDGKISVGLVAQNTDTCIEKSWISKPFDAKFYPPNLTTFHIYPGPQKDTVILTLNSPKLDENAQQITYTDRDKQFGHERVCSITQGIEYALLSSDLTSDKSEISGGFRFLNSPESRTRGLLTVEQGDCNSSSWVRLMDVSWLTGKDPMIHRYLGDRSPQTQLSHEAESIKQQFGVVVDWWSYKDGHLSYVMGTPGIQGALFKHFKEGQLNQKTNDFLLRSEFSIFVFNKIDQSWRKLVSQEECLLPRVLAYTGKPMLICVVPGEQNQYSRSQIYQFQ